jgi:hypothetical protein
MNVKPAFGWIMIALAGFLAIGVFVNAEERGWETSDTAMWWLLVFLPIAAGVYLITSHIQRNLSRRQNELEDEILRIIFKNKGAVSAAHLAHYTRLTLDDAEDTLRHLARRGHLSPDLSDSGVMLYTVGLATDEPGPRTEADLKGKGKTGDEDVGTGIRQLANLRRAVTVITWVLFAVLFTTSVFLTLFATRIWPQPV